jgi:tetratricopeptide (TPR) repeat protein
MMSSTIRGDDHDARLAALSAFEASINEDVDAGLGKLGTLNEPSRLHAALQLLIQNDRFQDAIDLVTDKPPQCKWIDLVVYAHVALKDIESARALLDFAAETCEASWVDGRCRIAAAEALFCEVLNSSLGAGIVASGGLSDDERQYLEFVIEVLNPIVAPVRLSGRADSTIQRAAVEFASKAYSLLGQFSQIEELVKPMARCQPVPLLLAQLTLVRVCAPPKGLSGRLRAEHPSSFSAHFLAAILDREVYKRSRQSLGHLVALQQKALDQGKEAIEQLCEGLFETASSMDLAALGQARITVDSLLGESNRYQVYFNAVECLMQGRSADAINELNANPRENDAVWWQIAARAYELSDDMAKAADCWEQACKLMPHPDMLNRFAGLSIQQHRFEDAVRALKSALVHSPDDRIVLEQLGFAHTRLRQFPEASIVFEKLSRLFPDISQYRINQAICHVHSGDPRAALAALDSVMDESKPDLQLIGLRTDILKSLDRAKDAFHDLNRLRSGFWNDPRFLVLFMDTAYRAGEDKQAHAAFQVLMAMQQSGQLPKPLFHPMTLEDLKKFGTERLRQRDSLFSEVVSGKLPWLVAESILGAVSDEAWYRRTQRLRWLPEDATSRGEWTIYSTNQFSVHKESDGQARLSQIGLPEPGEPVVADMSAIITLHRLGRLTLAANYFGVLILPASFGDLTVRDAQRLTQHQPSREKELKRIQDLVQRQMISTIDEGDITDGMAFVDEYESDEEASCFVLADVEELLREKQSLTSEELGELSQICNRKRRGDRKIARDSRIVFAMSTLRSLAKYDWLERVVQIVDWCVLRSDFDDEVRELNAYESQREIFSSNQSMWEEIKQLRIDGKLEYRDSSSCRDRNEAEEDYNGEDIKDDVDLTAPTFVDAALLAQDLGYRLLADDRVLQTSALNQHPEMIDAAFGSDRVLIALEEHDKLSLVEVANDLIRLMRWRYRFLLVEPRHLKVVVMRSRDSLPGPELREIAAYIQESMRDPGLFCGAEKADLPTPIAFKYFMAWKEVCVQFLATLWEDSSISILQLKEVTRWCLESLLPAVPRGMCYSPVGRRLGSFTPKAFMLTAMIRFATVQPVARANEALRLMAIHLGMTEEEFYETASEAADGRHD